MSEATPKTSQQQDLLSKGWTRIATTDMLMWAGGSLRDLHKELLAAKECRALEKRSSADKGTNWIADTQRSVLKTYIQVTYTE